MLLQLIDMRKYSLYRQTDYTIYLEFGTFSMKNAWIHVLHYNQKLIWILNIVVLTIYTYKFDNNNRVAMIDAPLNVWYTRTYIPCELK